MSNSQLNINQKFKNLIPPLSKDEYEGLKESIKIDGCRDSIVVWNNTIIDGHNRYEICQSLGISFTTVTKEFDDENEAKIWIIHNQFSRRNINAYTRAELALKLEDMLREKAKKNMSKGGGDKKSDDYKNKKSGLSNWTNPINDLNSNIEKDANEDESIKTINTRKKLAETAKTGYGTIARVKKINEKADDDTKQKLRDGHLTIYQVYKKIKDEEKGKTLESRKKQILEQTKKELEINKPEIKLMDCIEYLNEFEDNSIDLLITDPPYSTEIDDIAEFVDGWLPLALKKVKKSGRAYICIGAYPKELNTYLNQLLNQDKFILDNPLIWTYRNTLGQTPKMKYNLNYQVILHLYSKESQELDTSITNEMFSVQDINAPDGRLGNRFHTWQKPDELANRLIRHSSKENDLIVDCFACTGTFLISAAKLNRKAKGCDNNKDNVIIAKDMGCIIIGM